MHMKIQGTLKRKKKKAFCFKKHNQWNEKTPIGWDKMFADSDMW